MYRKMNNTDFYVNFLYKTTIGRMLLKFIMITRADKLLVWFLRSSLSRFYIPRYAKKHGIEVCQDDLALYRSYRDFFARNKVISTIDFSPGHLISPCDGWLSVYEINESSLFEIKGSMYSTADIVLDTDIANKYTGGICLVIRLCASDYHHYCYIDDCLQRENHYIPGELHSVQPAALEKHSVLAHNRRSWCVIDTDNFGSVMQAEIGAMVVGGIVNPNSNVRMQRGEEKGYFDLAGSTIVLMFETDRIKLLPEFQAGTIEHEVRVRQGMWIGTGR